MEDEENIKLCEELAENEEDKEKEDGKKDVTKMSEIDLYKFIGFWGVDPSKIVKKKGFKPLETYIASISETGRMSIGFTKKMEIGERPTVSYRNPQLWKSVHLRNHFVSTK